MHLSASFFALSNCFLSTYSPANMSRKRAWNIKFNISVSLLLKNHFYLRDTRRKAQGNVYYSPKSRGVPGRLFYFFVLFLFYFLLITEPYFFPLVVH